MKLLFGLMAAMTLGMALVFANASPFVPTSFSLAELKSLLMVDELKVELTSSGIVQVSIPSFKELRQKVLQLSAECSKVSDSARTTVFADGVHRRSLATVRNEDVHEPIPSLPPACEEFQSVSMEFRQLVDQVCKMFASNLDLILGTQSFLKDSIDNQVVYNTFSEIVDKAEHLEHFHTYFREAPTHHDSLKTVDLHIDQGLFIAFTPAMMFTEDGENPVQDTAEFVVQLGDKYEKVLFGENTLVFMLGDGVNQYINPKTAGKTTLQAVSHSLTLPKSTNLYRSWYGRMVLPPPTALSEEHGVSFGDLRNLMMENGQSDEVLSMGCSNNLYARELSEDNCPSNTLWCWHRCMALSEEISVDGCASKGLTLNCTSQEDLIVPPEKHGDFWPNCTNSTLPYTEAPTIAPPDESCPEYNVLGEMESYFGYRKLNDLTHLFWNMVDKEYVEFKIVVESTLGWAAIGFENIGGNKNGMNGANVVMGIVGFGGDSTSVNEYKIHDELSAFRWWSTPLNTSNLVDASMDIQGNCSASVMFTTKMIGTEEFDLTAPNRLVWAIHTSTWNVGYHGYSNRGHLNLDFNKATEDGSDDNQSPRNSGSMAVLHLLGAVLFGLFYYGLF